MPVDASQDHTGRKVGLGFGFSLIPPKRGSDLAISTKVPSSLGERVVARVLQWIFYGLLDFVGMVLV